MYQRLGLGERPNASSLVWWRVEGLGFRVQGLGCMGQGVEVGVQGLGFGV